jgi:plastocyanin
MAGTRSRREGGDVEGRIVGACAALAAAVAVTGCAGADAGSPADVEPTPKVTVRMVDVAYEPKHVRVPVGGRVTWVNAGLDGNTAESGGAGFFEYDREAMDRRNVFDVHTLQPGEAESVVFDTPGTYRVYSSLESSMRGTVEVVAAGE